MKQLFNLFKYSQHLKKYYLIIIFLSIVLALLGQVVPWLLRSVVDSLSEGGNFDRTIIFMLVGIFLAHLANNLLENFNAYLGDMLSIKLHDLLSKKYYLHLMRLPQSYFDDEHTGTIIGRLDRSIKSITDFMKQLTNLFFSVIVTSAISLIIVFYYVPPAAILIAVLFPIYMYFTNLSSKKWQKHQEVIFEEQDQANGRFAEVVSQLRVTKSFVQEASELNFYKNRYKKMITKTSEQSKQWHYIDIMRRLSQDLIFTASIGYIIYQAYEGDITIGGILFLFLLMQQAMLPLRFISFLVDNYQKMVSSSKDYFEVMALEQDPINNNSKKLKLKKNSIEVQAVDFRYSGEEELVLSDISFKVEPNKKLALVGESGGGKSTITQLLLGFYAPTQGHIFIDGQDVSKLSPASLRNSIGVVFQDALLFSGTIAENIAYGNPKASQKEIERAAKAANAHEFITKLKDGYKSEIGERGIKLSGGQKQRLAIARAILKDPPILILDEATSSLDRKSELIVQDALDKLMEHRTTIVIAHRLSTIAEVDTIVTLKNGAIDEVGSPKELEKSGGIYDQLLRLQDSNSKESKKLLKEFDIVA